MVYRVLREEERRVGFVIDVREFGNTERNKIGLPEGVFI